MPKSKKRNKKHNFHNSTFVRAFGEGGMSYNTTLGEIKNDFMNKKLPFKVKHLQIGSKFYFAHYHNTKGFVLEVI